MTTMMMSKVERRMPFWGHYEGVAPQEDEPDPIHWNIHHLGDF
jgi:hypothetical protein